MSMGFQTFIAGTSFDVFNDMPYNFIADIKNISGNGSTTYNLPGFTISAALIGNRTIVGTSTISYTVTVSGSTVTWSNIDITSKLVVTATPNAAVNYFGFSVNDYSTTPPTFKMAPDFTPFCLCQVIDLTPTNNQVLQTNVPSSQPFTAFHRSLTATGFDHVWWTETTQNGYWALKFRPALGTAMTSCRIYVFSRVLVNSPDWGFFLYTPGTKNMVWHSNCLPLRMIIGTATNSSVPLAITSGISVIISYPNDPAFPNFGVTRYNCYSAGKNAQGTYDAAGGDIYAQLNYTTSNGVPPAFSQNPPGYIQTNYYDAYYKQALGL